VAIRQRLRASSLVCDEMLSVDRRSDRLAR
jgi:hypothetical protein